ncbi:hybrid sensor histidine kinase/response regulator [Planktothrix agardhii 1806]|nr:hybrid sensor histidine kinase/response regulator [Planktothrix agardhii]MCB8752547.1 hybrid sensor histidine kinase/response regulator [Planktothrix agardhii 1810]MCF3569318.1 hybrid sensor histidine kinase/response regulator [Planktothrix agardhii 1805]MCF3584122.1 hybrid sensor histidine kinase/response regulator [Planktothrix agardhii 1803]MCF3604531.1 hybrid sensor histidine kinase/response regulator [Planktothrix agardhii 1804]MCF3614663.1 hybrid sensor histidine kinase/response regul
MIEDDELREVFKTASEEHLQNLDEGLLYLEKNPNDAAKIEELLREAHSLKGDAGMLGVKDVATLSHQIEHLLGGLKRQETTLTADLVDRISYGIDAIRQLVYAAVTGEPCEINAFHSLAYLMGAKPETPTDAISAIPTVNSEPPPPDVVEFESQEEPSEIEEPIIDSVPLPDVAPDETPIPVMTVAEPMNATMPPVTASRDSTYKIETIRVPTRNLDGLMTQTGELTVTKIRIAHRLNEIEDLVSLWEEWSRDAFVNRFVVHDLENNLNRYSSEKGTIGQLQNYYHRSTERLEQLGSLINQLRNTFSEDIARLDIISDELEDGIRTLRLLPLSTIFNLFPRMVRDLARQQRKEIELVISGGETRADKRILEEMKDPLMHILRNAIDHGIETPEERQKLGKPAIAKIELRGYQTATHIVLEVCDDGWGLDIEKIKQTALKRGICQPEELLGMTPQQIHSLIFAPGFTTRTVVTEVSGRGVGMDVVRTNVERLKGIIQVESSPRKGSVFRIQLGTTLATAHVLIVSVQGISYAVPVEFVQMTKLVQVNEIFAIEGRETIVFEDQPISVAQLADLLEIRWTSSQFEPESTISQESKSRFSLSPSLIQKNPSSPTMDVASPCIILKVGEEKLGLFVDALVDEQDVVLKPQSQLLKRVRNVAGATILGTGEVCIILSPQDLIKSIRKQAGVISSPIVRSALKVQDNSSVKPVILLVEDSITTRTQEKRILEAAGYEVVTAVDGLDGFNKLGTRSFDAVVSDIQMPNLDGLSLVTKIRQNRDYSELPIILVTSLASDEDKRKGAEVGANAYITKASFNQEVLIETLKRLV